MGIQKDITIDNANYGQPVSYWRPFKIKEYNSDLKYAVMFMSGYFSKASRENCPTPVQGYDWEFLIRNETNTVRTERAANDDEKAAFAAARNIPVTDPSVVALQSYDESKTVVPYFDNFSAKITSGVSAGLTYENALKDAMYDFINTNPLAQEYFAGSQQVN